VSGSPRADAVVRAWSAVARGYDAYWSPRFRPWIDDALAALAPPTLPGPLLVPGAGPGHEALALARRFPERRVLACDPAGPMRELLRARIAADPQPNLEVHDAPADGLAALASGLASGLLCTFTFQLLADHARVLEDWSRALAPAARAVVLFWPRQRAPSAWGRLGDAIERVSGAPRGGWEPGLRPLLDRGPWRLEREETLVHTIVHATPREAWDQLVEACSMRVLLDRLGAEDAEACARAWLQDPGLTQRPDGQWEHQAAARLWVLERTP
jgi:SAM-dependent methyltransferase